jgi:hypothetical protein
MDLKERMLVWQLTRDFASDGAPREREFFACSDCSWAFRTQNLPQKEHDQVEVNREFNEHVCKRVQLPD